MAVLSREPGTHSSQAPDEGLRPRLHLMAGLETAWTAKPREQPGFRQLEQWLACHPEICLTLVSHVEPDLAQAWIDGHLDLMPHHLVCAGGQTLHHLQGSASWARDDAYTEWLEVQKQVRSHENEPLSPLVVALGFLEIHWRTPRPLAVFGSPAREFDLLALADIPVPTGGTPQELEPFSSRMPTPLGSGVGRKGLMERLRTASSAGMYESPSHRDG